jgi:alanine racemase
MPTLKPTDTLRPTEAEIDLSAFRYNLNKIRKTIGANCKSILSIKANAYGHGMIKLARFAQKENIVDGFAVALIEEGIELRQTGIKLPILVLGSIYPFYSFKTAIENNLSVTIASIEAAKHIVRKAKKLKIITKCHIKVDTGLGRIGPRKPNAIKVAKYLASCSNIKLEGIYTHFASADSDRAYTALQLKYFKDTIEECKKNNIDIAYKHCANSYSMIKYRQSHFNMVRPGMACYGLHKGFKPILTLKSKIVFLKQLKKGSSISYGCTYKCKKLTQIATVPIGYGDGYFRALSNKGFVLINGKKCKIIGIVTMDMIMVDVSDLANVKIGNEVILIGKQRKKEITANDVAKIAKTISYEITTSILPRVPRVYKNEI